MWQNQQFGSFKKKKRRGGTAPASSGTPKPHRMWLKMSELFQWLRKINSQHLTNSRAISRRYEYYCQSVKSRDTFMKYRLLTTKCNPLVTLKYKKTRLDLACTVLQKGQKPKLPKQPKRKLDKKKKSVTWCQTNTGFLVTRYRTEDGDLQTSSS